MQKQANIKEEKNMKKKVLYIAALVTISIGCFFVGKIQIETNATENNIERMEKSFSHITDWKTEENTLYIYTNDGNYYSLEK